MIVNVNELTTENIINFGTAKNKQLGKVSLVASVNPQMKIVEGVCIKTGDKLQSTEVNNHPVCVFDKAYILDYLSK